MKSVAVLEEFVGDAEYRNAFGAELLGVGFGAKTADSARSARSPVGESPRFFLEIATDVLGVAHGPPERFVRFALTGPELAVAAAFEILGDVRASRARHTGDARSARSLLQNGTPADGTRKASRGRLRLPVEVRLEPAFEEVSVRAKKVENFERHECPKRGAVA